MQKDKRAYSCISCSINVESDHIIDLDCYNDLIVTISKTENVSLVHNASGIRMVLKMHPFPAFWFFQALTFQGPGFHASGISFN